MYRLPTTSMEPSIKVGALVPARLSEEYRNHIERFDIAIYETKKFPGSLFMKRVIGLPGEAITINAEGITIDGKHLILPPTFNTAGFTKHLEAPGLGNYTDHVKIPQDAIFLMGDNSENSLDSRYLGPISKKSVLGRLLLAK